jgi:hypothetical protein
VKNNKIFKSISGMGGRLGMMFKVINYNFKKLQNKFKIFSKTFNSNKFFLKNITKLMYDPQEHIQQ